MSGRHFLSPPRKLAPSLIAPLLLLACSQTEPPAPPPLSDRAMAAVGTEPGVPREDLARAVDALFTDETVGETRALLVMHNGEVVAERYADGFDADMPLIGWSMGKTVTGLLTGVMLAEGRLELDEPAPVALWRRAGDPRATITLRHLLQMRSGLHNEENIEPLYSASEVRMLFLEGREDMAGWAEAQPLRDPPGERFAYATATTVIIADIIADTLAPDGSPRQRQQAVADFMTSRLAEPLGAPSLRGEYDRTGTLVGGSWVFATARDWGKVGELLRNGGSVGGVQVVPRRWVEFMRQSSPASPDYGAHLWLNRNAEEAGRDGFFGERVSTDIFAMRGHLGQFVHVSPAQGLTVVRLGKSEGSEGSAAEGRIAELMALYPSR